MKTLLKCFEIKENVTFPELGDFHKLANEISNDSRVTIYKDGKSRAGKHLIAFAIGKGSKVIGVTSGAHADEPIGVLTQYYFIKTLVNDNRFNELLNEYTFLCHPMVDPDGYELNKIWFTNPLNFKNYWLNNFRNNSPAEDCEHGIPFQEGQTARPELLFVKKNFDLFKGQFEYYVTLHSSHILPGTCFVFDRDHSDLKIRQNIVDLCHSYDLPLMDFKSRSDESMTYLGPGFIGAPNVSSMLSKYKNQPEILKQIKMTTYEYAQTYCGAKSSFISELPIWIMQGMDDYSDSSMTMNEFKQISLTNNKEYLKLLKEIEGEIIKFNPNPDNQWFKAFQMALKRGTSMIQDEETQLGSYEGFAQVLEVKELDFQSIENQCKVLKYAIKSLEGVSVAKDSIAKYQEKFDKHFQIFETKLRLKQLSIKTQVEVQIGLIFSGLIESKSLGEL